MYGSVEISILNLLIFRGYICAFYDIHPCQRAVLVFIEAIYYTREPVRHQVNLCNMPSTRLSEIDEEGKTLLLKINILSLRSRIYFEEKSWVLNFIGLFVHKKHEG